MPTVVTHHKAAFFLGAAAALFAATEVRAAGLAADNLWPLCHSVTPPFDTDAQLDSALAPTDITADYGEGVNDELYTVRGNVLILRGAQRINADQAVYDDRSGQVDAEGTVRLQQRGFIVEGESARFDLTAETGQINQARYQYLDRHAHGQARTVIRESAEITQLLNASYTTCDPGEVDWELRARRVTLDHAEAVGTARGVTLRFQNVPFLYFPYINFPLDGNRKSGLLPPTVGYSDETGLDFGQPVYWNIAPQYDATITPRILGTRGLLTQVEFRYLTPDNGGIINVEYLPNDAVFGADRGALSFQHMERIDARWRADANFNYVSDSRYLAELGGNLSSASATHLDRRLDVTYSGDYNYFLARLQDYQTIDEATPVGDRPYQRLPQLLFSGVAPSHPLGGDYALDAELTRFEREQSVTGTRISLHPSIAWPVERLGYFFIPKAGLRYTGYRLDEVGPGTADAPQHSVPVYSLDGGLYLERDIEFRGRPFLHTLEPRLFYLRIPFRDQTDFPVFDTSAFDFSFSQLFRDNRFTGPDRLSDANQLSAGVTSRLLDRGDGREWLRAALGQIYYFEAPRVGLPGVPLPSRGESDLVGELSTRLTARWTASGSLQWNPDADETERAAVQFRYQGERQQLFNAGYRFRRDELDQTDLSLLWPLRQRWQFIGRWNYSHRDQRVLETLAGLQYDSCCWAFRATTRRYVNTVSGDNNQALYLQLELKGLANIGNSVEDVLEHGILGYRAR